MIQPTPQEIADAKSFFRLSNTLKGNKSYSDNNGIILLNALEESEKEIERLKKICIDSHEDRQILLGLLRKQFELTIRAEKMIKKLEAGKK